MICIYININISKCFANNNQMAQPMPNLLYTWISLVGSASPHPPLLWFLSMHIVCFFNGFSPQTRHIWRTSTPQHLKIDSLKPTPFSRKGIVQALLFRCNLVVLGRLYSSFEFLPWIFNVFFCSQHPRFMQEMVRVVYWLLLNAGVKKTSTQI